MGFSELTTSTSGNGGQYSSRNGVKIDRIILHHCASTSLSGVLGMMSSGSREVSANYVIGKGGEIVGVVPEEYRAWTSGSSSWDGRAITFEIVNESGGPDWRISAKAMGAVERILADISGRYGIPLSRDTVVTHQELYTIHGASYATACPGPYLQARVGDLIAAANAPVEIEIEGDDMSKPMLAMKLDGGPMNTLGVMIDPDGTVVGLDKGQWEFWKDRAKIVPVECKNPGHWEYLMNVMAKRRDRAGVKLSSSDLEKITAAVRGAVDGLDQVSAAEVAEQLQIVVKG